MINFAPTRPVDISPEEYDRQARLLLPLQAKQMGSLVRSGAARELPKSCLLFGAQPSEQIGEGTTFKVFRNRWHYLGLLEQKKIQQLLGDTSVHPLAQVLFVEREDTKKANAAFKISSEYTYAIGATANVTLHDDDEEYIAIGDIGDSTVKTIAECCRALAAARESHRLTMIDPATLEECWNVPDAPIGWKPLDWV